MAGLGILLFCSVGLRRLAQLGCYGVSPQGLFDAPPPTCEDGVHKYVDFMESFVDLQPFGIVPSTVSPSAAPADSAATGFARCMNAPGEAMFLGGSIFLLPQIVLGAALFCGGLGYLALLAGDIDMTRIVVETQSGEDVGDLGGSKPTRVFKATDVDHWKVVVAVARTVLSCRGAYPLCCAPVGCRRDCWRRSAPGAHESGQTACTAGPSEKRASSAQNRDGEELQTFRGIAGEQLQPEPTYLGQPSHAQGLSVHRRSAA